MIQKVINYCWFGGNPLTEKVEKCIASWEEFLPDYEIVQWNENNFDVNMSNFAKEAYEQKSWAFVADYCRFWVLNKYGGIYFDSDVEVVKNFDDLLNADFFVGYESEASLEPATMGSVVGHTITKKMLERFDSMHYKNEDGSCNREPLPSSFTKYIVENYSLKINSDEIAELSDGVVIYPKSYFSPMDMFSFKVEPCEYTYSIHRFTNSWRTEKELKGIKRYNIYRKIFGKRIGSTLAFNGFFGTIVKLVKYPFRKKKINK